MGDSWEDEADDFADSSSKKLPVLTDKWEDEDLDDVPDAWDAEPEPAPAAGGEGKKAEGEGSSTKSKKRSKALAAALEKKEKEAEEKRRLAEKADAAEGADGQSQELSKEELRRMQEESDLLLAKDAFGVNDSVPSSCIDPQKSIDLIQPVSKEDFERLNKLISQKLRQLETSPHYPQFVESLFRECTLELDCENLRKLSTMFSALATEKQKLQKAGTKGKKKGKGVVKVERDAGAAYNEDMVYDEYDDFI